MPLLTRLLGVCAAGGLVAFILALILRPGPEAQVERFFADLDQAITAYDTIEIFALVDADYDLLAHWPPARHIVPDNHHDDSAMVHEVIRQFCARILFLRQRVQAPPPNVSVSAIEAVEPQEDGLVSARITLAIDDHQFRRLRVDPPRQVDFTFRRHGWLRPQLQVLSHDPLL